MKARTMKKLFYITCTFVHTTLSLTLGTRFAVKVPGTITKVRMYVGAEESGSYTVEIWDTAAEELVAGPYFWDLEKGQAGWREYELEEPLQVKAYNDYTVAIRNTTGSLSYQYIKGYYQDHERYFQHILTVVCIKVMRSNAYWQTGYLILPS